MDGAMVLMWSTGLSLITCRFLLFQYLNPPLSYFFSAPSFKKLTCSSLLGSRSLIRNLSFFVSFFFIKPANRLFICA